MEEPAGGVYARQILEFVTVADQFCKHVDRVPTYKPSEILSIVQRLGPFLYVKAANLPKTEPVFEEGNERFVTEEEWTRIEKAIAAKLVSINTFEEAYDQSLHGSGEPAAGAISEYIADIYQDLKDFLMQYNTGTEEVMNDAIWECSMHFETAWGRKLLGTLRAIHSVLYSGTDIDSQTEGNPMQQTDTDQDTSSWFLSKRQQEYGE
jgi:hypothetical protein